ncbi:translation elongation factor aEF-1 beta subunit [Vulcanisaeta moutnovskia 768-28]|uniref:Elongation factor 1-beta n=1 Tax=Vulcanisaeta moutnovskia (strain 768-28) TaxID=985053 RepID=F0QXA8_VULM7|nr:elongation factor 1-beta [Vulcanisaeta moutnovskia]ADY01147.1 translation elongation factor aEF-1 beta subunit [Vulcanisaeta moutnovskia 768-28]
MAEVYLIYRVTPSKSDVNYEELKNEIKKALEPKYRVDKVDEEDIGFGIKAIRVYIRMPEESEEHSSDEVENILSGIEGIGSIELEYFTRLGF